jgi:hypothetical protein
MLRRFRDWVAQLRAGVDSLFPLTEPPSDWSDDMPSRVAQWDELPVIEGVCDPCPYPETCSARSECGRRAGDESGPQNDLARRAG